MSKNDRATARGTQALRDRFAPAVYRPLGELWLSSIGWSTSQREGREGDALVRSVVDHGLNVFDVFSHARGGAPEAAIARGLRAGARAELVVLGHAGFLSERVLGFGAHAQAVQEQFISRGTFEWGDLAGGNHCIAPRFLIHSAEQSRQRLGTGVDVLLLDSPGLQLSVNSALAFERRLGGALEALERCVADGDIGCYGIADPGPIQLELAVRLARAVAGSGHHLRAVHFPLSLHTAGAALARSQVVAGRRCSVLEAARELGLYAIGSGVIQSGQPQYDFEPEVRRHFGDVMTDTQIAIQWARSLPGMGTVLCGMRRAAHIDENARVSRIPPMDPLAAAAFVPEEGA